MTTAARIVLEDCRGALAELGDGLYGGEWRRRWIAAVTLLRAVGHVLDKVDARTSPQMKKAIQAEWKLLKASKPKPKIFWDFIDAERNHILKEYRLAAGQSVTVQIVGVQARAYVAGRSEDPSEDKGRAAHALSTYSYPIVAGPFKGRDQRELIAEAIKWWGDYLERIDNGC